MIGSGGLLYGIGETYHGGFSTRNPTTGPANASAVSGVLVVNGADTAAVVAITNPAVGRYVVTCSLAGRTIGDDCWIRITATVAGQTDEERLPGFRIAFPAAIDDNTFRPVINEAAAEPPRTVEISQVRREINIIPRVVNISEH